MKQVMILLSCITLGPGFPPQPRAQTNSVPQVRSVDGEWPGARIEVSSDVEAARASRAGVVAASATDFAPATVTVVAGKLKSGDASSVASQDGAVLKIKSVMLDGSFGDIVEYDFNTGLNPTTPSITFAIIQHTAIAPQREQLSVFNFSTGSFELLAEADLSFPSTVTRLSITNPSHFVSDTGEMRLQVRVGDSQPEPWKHLIDQVSLTSAS